ncbi:MAG: glycine--tRNA ligase, partial [archaeon]
THPKVWIASGHVESFSDPLLECVKCKQRTRADHLIEDKLKIQVDGISLDQVNALVKKHNLKCPYCGGALLDARKFNLMFKTHVGPIENDSNVAYLRPETAQVIFADFKQVADISRLKLPFGIAQIGRAYRNEISPRDFLFRSREFEQMEIEYFVHPEKLKECPYLTKDTLKQKIRIYSAIAQEQDTEDAVMTLKEAMDEEIIKSPWLAYFLSEQYNWFTALGISEKNLRLRQHKEEELAHYAKGCFDIEYRFPFGWKEIHGMADRSSFDLTQHMAYSKKDLSIFDEEDKKKIVPCVAAEPSQGVDRAFLAFIIDAYTQEKDRFLLKLDPRLAPLNVAVFPLMKKDGLKEKAEEVHNMLKKHMISFFDASGSVGKRYARMDEIGCPYCVTIDYDSLKNNDVTLRDRDTTKQARIPIKNLKDTLTRLLSGEIIFEKAGILKASDK